MTFSTAISIMALIFSLISLILALDTATRGAVIPDCIADKMMAVGDWIEDRFRNENSR